MSKKVTIFKKKITLKFALLLRFFVVVEIFDYFFGNYLTCNFVTYYVPMPLTHKIITKSSTTINLCFKEFLVLKCSIIDKKGIFLRICPLLVYRETWLCILKFGRGSRNRTKKW